MANPVEHSAAQREGAVATGGEDANRERAWEKKLTTVAAQAAFDRPEANDRVHKDGAEENYLVAQPESGLRRVDAPGRDSATQPSNWVTMTGFVFAQTGRVSEGQRLAKLAFQTGP